MNISSRLFFREGSLYMYTTTHTNKMFWGRRNGIVNICIDHVLQKVLDACFKMRWVSVE